MEYITTFFSAIETSAIIGAIMNDISFELQ